MTHVLEISVVNNVVELVSVCVIPVDIVTVVVVVLTVTICVVLAVTVTGSNAYKLWSVEPTYNVVPLITGLGATLASPTGFSVG